jgi:twinkle protein
MFFNWSKYGIEIPYGRMSGQVRTTCPKCSADRKKKYDKCLSINLDDGKFNCHNCGWAGCVAEEDDWEKQQRMEEWKKQHKPEPKKPIEYKVPTQKGTKEYSEKFINHFAKRGISVKTMTECGITEGMEMMPRKDDDPGEGMIMRNTIQFNYYLDGKLINTKFKTHDKKFKFVSGARLIPYNIDSVKGQKYCIWTEGEFDALSFHEIGYTSVVSVPSGGGHKNLDWLDDFMAEYFDDKETIYIASDTDTRGVELKDELVRRFGIDRCKVINDYGEGCKDANDVLQKYDKETLKKVLLKADFLPVDGVFAVNDLKADLDALYEKGWQKGVTIGLPEFDNICSFETGRVCIVTGIPTSGKSEFVDFMTVMLNQRYGWKTVYFSPENFPITYHIAKISEKLIGKPFSKERENRMSRAEYEVAAEYINDNFFFIYPTDNCQVDNVLEKAKAFVHRKGCKIVVLDPYNRLDHDNGSERETVYISKFLDKLTYFAQKHGVLLILVAHPTKLPKNKEGFYDPPTLYDISGSSAFYAKADFGITIHRDVQEMCVLAIANKVKFKHLGEIGKAKLQYNINNGRYSAYEFGKEMQWDNSNFLQDLMPSNEGEEYTYTAPTSQTFAPNPEFEKKAAATESIVPTIDPTVTPTSDDIYWA